MYREFSCHTEIISRKNLMEVLFALVELVEEFMSARMREAKRATMYDSWTDCGVHYI